MNVILLKMNVQKIIILVQLTYLYIMSYLSYSTKKIFCIYNTLYFIL